MGKHRENVGKIQDIEVSKVATYPNHLPLCTILNKTRFKEKVHRAVVKLGDSTNGKKIESKLRHI